MAKPPAPARSARSIAVRDAALTLFADRGYHATSMKDIAAALQLQAPSLYNHVSAKQDLLHDIMAQTMNELLKTVRSALASSDDLVEQLRRASEAHVRYHARHPREVRVGNHEIAALEEPHRREIVELRRTYSDLFVALIARGVAAGVFETRSPLLAAYAILQMGIGVSMWFHPDGALSEDDVVFQYGDIALGVAGGPRPRRSRRAGRAGRPRR
ncbi:MAG TPA: TetR/AcrR family transcriptional regulator [Kofleriaceae bacterium]|nr:TetR/AcrR family transcriptional regulator [Kofleriaceae bacterium]